MEWIYAETKVSDQGSLDLSLSNRKKERKNEKTLFFYIANSGIPDCFHECMGA
jgi:hypothetical protein